MWAGRRFNRINILKLICLHHKFTVFIFILTFIVILNTLINTHVLTVFCVIDDDNINGNLVRYNFTNIHKSSCGFKNYSNKHLLELRTNVPNDIDTWATSLNLISGGEWSPISCSPNYLVAIVIPYRNRPEHLKTFLYNIHPFLQEQNLHYKVFVIEQSEKKEFNRGKLFNVGFVEALKEKSYPCFIFHDVDLIPQNLNNIYACTNYPRHMSSSIDKYRYKIPYDRNFGGVLSITTEQFKLVNGFSNKYFGWGGEDDDFFWRVRHVGYKLARFQQHISRYRSLSHEPAQPSDTRFEKLSHGYGAYKLDGLSDLKYPSIKIQDTLTHTKIIVDL